MDGSEQAGPDAGVPEKDNRETDQDPEQGNKDPLQDQRLAHFIGLLSDDDEVSRWKAAEALGRIGDPEAVDELISTLWDDDANVRMKAAWALGQIGDRRAYAPLQRLYRMETERTKEIIEEALENIRQEIASGNQ
jgi:HEAT repeat protein